MALANQHIARAFLPATTICERYDMKPKPLSLKDLRPGNAYVKIQTQAPILVKIATVEEYEVGSSSRGKSVLLNLIRQQLKPGNPRVE